MTSKLTALVAAITLLSGCSSSTATSGANGGAAGGTGSGSSNGNGGGSINTPIQGIATPSSVAVVTATNAN
jgi:hypothetical protein